MREIGRRERDEDKGQAGLHICGGMWSFVKVRGGPCIIPPPDPPGHWASAAGVCSETPGSWPTPRGIQAATRRVEKAGYIQATCILSGPLVRTGDDSFF